MVRRSKVHDLPLALRQWLDAELVRNGFSNYEELAAHLKGQGEDVSKSSLQRYGSTLSKLKSSINMARVLVNDAPDDEGNLNAAVMRVAQEKIFNLLLEVDIDPESVDINKLFKSAAEIGRASVTQKKWQVEARARANAAADLIGKEAKKAGMTPEVIQKWREEVLGVAAK